ncbi:terminase small subunit [Bradyrhizobium cosmicum]|uniref:terminase small subunit n=1 Tax=Bradyrhizobium cosmicum TaxID=1404864 RepID=UPI0028E18DA9|nr:terminase small subunit [Bradyrhizobium cosmicum]
MAPLRNHRHEMFCHQVLASKGNAAAAYSTVYDRSGHVAEAAGSRLLKRVEVQARIAEINAPVVRKSRVSLEGLLSQLEQTITAAREDRNHAAVNTSLALMAKLCGMLRDQVEVGPPGAFGGQTVEEVVDGVVEEFGSAAAAAAQLRELAGMIEERAGLSARNVTPRISAAREGRHLPMPRR